MSAADAAAAGVGSTGAMASIYEALGITAAEAGPIGVAVAANIAFILKGIELAYDMGRAGFGSGTHEAIDTGIYGGLPDVTKGWFQMPGSSQPAPLGLITGFEKGIVDMVKNTYGMVDKALNPLDAAVATRARAALATMNIDYMPDYPGLVSGTNIDLTRETTRGALIQQAVYEGNLETGTYHETTPQIIVDTTADYLLKISPYILGQIAPVLEAAQAQQNAIYGSSDTMKVGGSSFDEGWGVPHKTGLDFVPFDNYPARLHKGERVQTASERSDLVEEFRALREEMKVNLYAITKNTAKVAKTTDRWDQDGMPPDRNGITAKWDTEGLPPERP
jgi:hypothetical protein